MLKYAIKIEKDGSSFVGTCDDFPTLICPGDSHDEVLRYAVEGLEVAISIFIDERKKVPAPTTSNTDYLVTVPFTTAIKACLNNLIIDSGISYTELALRMGIHKQAVPRLLDIQHKSKIEQLEKALAVLGYQLDFTVSIKKAA